MSRRHLRAGADKFAAIMAGLWSGIEGLRMKVNATSRQLQCNPARMLFDDCVRQNAPVDESADRRDVGK